MKVSQSDKELEELLSASPDEEVYFPVSCQEYADKGVIKNGSYRIQPNTTISSFTVECEFYDDVGYTVFRPSFSQSVQSTATPHKEDGCEEPGCYQDLVTYRSLYIND